MTIVSSAWGQVTINEFVDDERTGGANQVTPDTREFVELYNAGVGAVDISGWKLITKQLGANFTETFGTTTYDIPGGQSIPAGGYYLIKAPAVAAPLGVGFFEPAFPTGRDLFPDGVTITEGNPPVTVPEKSTSGNYVLELRNAGSVLIDAVADETFRGTERARLTNEQFAQVGGGWWGQDPSFNVSGTRFSQSRFKNGIDTNINGRDFGMLPLSPGLSNNAVIPSNAVHTIPNVDGLGLEEDVPQYYASFVMPRAIDPTNADGNTINPLAIPASPQGGKAIIAYDETGGGNATYSRELVHKFDLYAYIDTGAMNTTNAAAPTADLQDSEATIYGLGTTDGLFGTPDPLNNLTVSPNILSSQNGSTGVGWMIERHEACTDATCTARTMKTNLLLIDFGDGGDSVPEDHEWEVMKQYDLSAAASDWHRLSIEHDPATGRITAKHGVGTGPLETITYSFPTDYNDDNVVDAGDYVTWRKAGALKNEAESVGVNNAEDYAAWRAHTGERTQLGEIGTFYVGYRENVFDVGDGVSSTRPPIFDMIGGPGAGSLVSAVPEPSAMVLAVMGMALAAAGRRRS